MVPSVAVVIVPQNTAPVASVVALSSCGFTWSPIIDKQELSEPGCANNRTQRYPHTWYIDHSNLYGYHFQFARLQWILEEKYLFRPITSLYTEY